MLTLPLGQNDAHANGRVTETIYATLGLRDGVMLEPRLVQQNIELAGKDARKITKKIGANTDQLEDVLEEIAEARRAIKKVEEELGPTRVPLETAAAARNRKAERAATPFPRAIASR